MLVHPGFEGLKVISVEKDRGRERVPVPCSHAYWRMCPALFQFIRERLLGIGKTRATRKAYFGGNYLF